MADDWREARADTPTRLAGPPLRGQVVRGWRAGWPACTAVSGCATWRLLVAEGYGGVYAGGAMRGDVAGGEGYGREQGGDGGIGEGVGGRYAEQGVAQEMCDPQ